MEEIAHGASGVGTLASRGCPYFGIGTFMLGKLLYLRDGELRRLLPFFLLYLVLFIAFSLADGLALALFVQNVGAGYLPQAFGLVAVANLVVMALYVLLAERSGSVRTFHLILAGNLLVFGSAWLALAFFAEGGAWYGVLFVSREIAFTLMLMHFGTFLQDYFSRDELNRVLPLVYSGGRVGGILGGLLLEGLAGPLGLVNLLGVFVALCGAGSVLLAVIAARFANCTRPEDHLGDAGVVQARAREGRDPEAEAHSSYLGFLRFVWASPLLFWVTVTTVLFMLCRWLLNFQYSSFFGRHFADDRAMAEFLGRYTQYALLGSLVVQLLVVNRLVAWIGLKGAHLAYSGLLVLGLLLCVGEMTFALAVFARLVESELRFGLRNPIMQLITNKFPKSLRVRVRAWGFGMVIPITTLACSLLLWGLASFDASALVPVLGALFGLGYFAASFGLLGSFSEPRKPPAVEAEQVRATV
jgi:ATP/ADP translocase